MVCGVEFFLEGRVLHTQRELACQDVKLGFERVGFVYALILFTLLFVLYYIRLVARIDHKTKQARQMIPRHRSAQVFVALCAWLGSLPTHHVNQLMVYSKLGGKFLGFVDKPCMQNQVVTSCKATHPNLGSVEVSIKQFAAKKLPNVHGFSWECVNVDLEGSRAFVM